MVDEENAFGEALTTYILKTETSGVGTDDYPICLVLYDPDTEVALTFGAPDAPPILDGVLLALGANVITHSRFHTAMLERTYGVQFANDRVLDTLLAAKLLCGQSRNALGEWAHRLGLPRNPYKGDTDWTMEAESHALHDCKIIAALYAHIMDTISGRVDDPKAG